MEIGARAPDDFQKFRMPTEEDRLPIDPFQWHDGRHDFVTDGQHDDVVTQIRAYSASVLDAVESLIVFTAESPRPQFEGSLAL
jgi:hypothetical protein